MSEWDYRQGSLDIPGVHASSFPKTFLGKADGYFSLICTHDFHALSKDHQGFIDVACLFQTVTSGLGMLSALGASEIHEGKSRDLQSRWILLGLSAVD